MLTRTLAAALSSAIALRIVAPSFVTIISPVDLSHVRMIREIIQDLGLVGGDLRGLKDFIHAFWAQGALHQISHGNRANEC